MSILGFSAELNDCSVHGYLHRNSPGFRNFYRPNYHQLFSLSPSTPELIWAGCRGGILPLIRAIRGRNGWVCLHGPDHAGCLRSSAIVLPATVVAIYQINIKDTSVLNVILSFISLAIPLLQTYNTSKPLLSSFVIYFVKATQRWRITRYVEKRFDTDSYDRCNQMPDWEKLKSWQKPF